MKVLCVKQAANQREQKYKVLGFLKDKNHLRKRKTFSGELFEISDSQQGHWLSLGLNLFCSSSSCFKPKFKTYQHQTPPKGPNVFIVSFLWEQLNRWHKKFMLKHLFFLILRCFSLVRNIEAGIHTFLLKLRVQFFTCTSLQLSNRSKRPQC